jgi:hypothetical protein
MQNEENQSKGLDKQIAAVCGLYCKACTLYIATTEDPARLKGLAELFQVSEETVRCYGCRAEKRGPYCAECKMFACSAEQGIDFCVECETYPCDDLKAFQSAMPHRVDLWDELERIKNVGYEQWLTQVCENYACPQCGSVNSAYDLVCRTCNNEPSCEYVARNRGAIEQYLKSLS